MPRLFVAALACVTIWVLFDQPVRVVGRADDVSGLIAPLVPAVYASVVPSCALRFADPIERLSPYPAWRRRLWFSLAVLGLGLVAVWASGQAAVGFILYRNTVALLGLALLSGVLPERLQSIPTTLLALTTWLLGTPQPGVPVAPWATLLHDSKSLTAAAAAYLLFCIGAGLFVAGTLRPPGAKRLIARFGLS